MKTGLNEVARLGTSGSRYPHVLVDLHNWCLRLGPDPKKDDKYYSSLTNLLQGLLEQGVRRSMLKNRSVAGIDELVGALRNALESMVEIGRRLEGIINQSPAKPVRHPGPAKGGSAGSAVVPVPA